MLELVRFQKKGAMTAGCEEVVYSSRQMFFAKRRNQKGFEGLAYMPIYSIPLSTDQEDSNIKNHIWGL